MKSMLLRLIMLSLTLAFVSMTQGCGKCSGENPRARIINNGYEKASVQIQTSGGNTININNVLPGSSSGYSDFAPGLIELTVASGSMTDEKEVNMPQCTDCDIIVNADATVTYQIIDRTK